MPITWQGFEPRGPVRIGDNVWFGVNCVVTGGVEIGDRAVIGANSVVTRDVPAGDDRRRRPGEGDPRDRVQAEGRAGGGDVSVRAGTYSIVARDPATGELGVAVQSHWFSVGSIVTWARAGVGAVATQSIAEPAYGPRLLERLARGRGARGGARGGARRRRARRASARSRSSTPQARIAVAHGRRLHRRTPGTPPARASAPRRT